MSRHNLKFKKLPFQSIVAQSGIEHLVDEVVDPDSKRELVEDAAKYAKHVEALKAVAMPKAKAKAVPKNVRNADQKDLEVVDAARKFLPLVPGCALSNETEWHTRFKVTYPAPWLPDPTSA